MRSIELADVLDRKNVENEVVRPTLRMHHAIG
jgi:hypothetical protein